MFCIVACSGQEETRTIGPAQVAMTEDLAPIYDDGELTLYEVKASLALPILAPNGEAMNSLSNSPMEPYGRTPWVTNEDVRVQVTWTLSNLDPERRVVEILIDPWNEFGRYWPGLAIIDSEDGEALPNLSGYDLFIDLPGLDDEESARRGGTISFDDMNEMATDFATVMAILQNPPTDGQGFEDAEITTVWANHAFNIQNRSFSDPLVQAYVPAVIAGLTGFDFGLRTREPANLALEIVVEVVDNDDTDRVVDEDSDDPIFETPEDYITAGQ